MIIHLTPCPELYRLYRLWFASPPEATVDDVWSHRQACPICDENTRLLTEQAKVAEVIEVEA